MTPAAILATARLSPLSPVVPARGEWLKGWQGPAVFLLAGDGWHSGVVYDLTPTGFCHGIVWIREPASLESAGFHLDNVRLDLRRPEVRDHLVRMGAPEWCRESVAGMLAWVLGVTPLDVLPAWAAVDHSAAPWTRRSHPMAATFSESTRAGWIAVHNTRFIGRGPEPGPEGRACSDLAALSAGCVLAESDGWFIPLPGGNVGWLPKEVSDV